MRNVISWLVVFLLTGGLVIVARDVASAHAVPQPKCDFMTSGGWVITSLGARANFGAHGGCKHGAFWGNMNFLDHGITSPFHVHGDPKLVTGYLTPSPTGDTTEPERDTCGYGRIVKGGFIASDSPYGPFFWSDGEPIRYRWSGRDNGEPGGDDRFGIRVRDTANTKEYLLRKRELGPAGPTGGGGNIQLHKPNPSTTPPDPLPTEFEMCGPLESPN